MVDWTRDLEWARERGLVSESGNEFVYKAFHKSIFDLVDLWTETAEEEEYVDMIRRLIDGVTQRGFLGRLCWRSDSDIWYDSHFSMHGDEAVNAEDGRTLEWKPPKEDSDPSILASLTAGKEKKKEFFISAEKVNRRIAEIYQAKQQADLWANQNDNSSAVRLDRFVLRFFMLQVGTLGAARRHLRGFARSALHHLHAASNGLEECPRIYLFCCLTGLESPDAEFNPRISAEFFQPALRSLFPNSKLIEQTFNVSGTPPRRVNHDVGKGVRAPYFTTNDGWRLCYFRFSA
jgi:hypothetical protein